MSKITLLNGYVGSKAEYVSKIDSLFDNKCYKYCEPFAGGAAKYFSHYNGKYEEEWLNDINANLAVLYKALADENTREQVMKGILELEKNDNKEIAEKLFNENKKKLLSPQTSYDFIKRMEPEKLIKSAILTYMVYSQSMNCNAGKYRSLKSNTKYKYETKRNLLNAVDRLRICPKITCLDGVKIVRRNKNNTDIQFFLDPPYIGVYRLDSNIYTKEMAGLYAHIQLAQEIADAKAAIVLCGYRCKHEGVPTIYDALLTSDEWHCFKLATGYKKSKVVKKGEPKPKATEYVWTNRVPERAKYYLSMVDYKEQITMEQYWDRIYNACMAGEIINSKEVKEYDGTYERLNGERLFTDKFIEDIKKREQEEKKKKLVDQTEKN
jgi:site-specific DNA-adenine methylase